MAQFVTFEYYFRIFRTFEYYFRIIWIGRVDPLAALSSLVLTCVL